MAILIKTSQPAELLNAIKEAIDNEKIKTWDYDTANDFTHNPAQWNKKAWLKPEINKDELRFSILKPAGESNLSKTIKGVYFGRFSEMLCTHFENSFTSIITTVP